MKVRHIAMLILSVIIVMACTQKKLVDHSVSMTMTHRINLLVTGNGSDLVVSTGPMAACNRPHAPGPNGCMVFEHNEKGEIPFHMNGGSGTQKFYITQLKICKGATAPSPKDKDCILSVSNALEFYVEAPNGGARVPDKDTGKVEWPYAQNVEEFTVFNENRLEQSYYYLVIACDGPKRNPDDITSVDPSCIDTDPPMDNKGLN